MNLHLDHSVRKTLGIIQNLTVIAVRKGRIPRKEKKMCEKKGVRFERIAFFPNKAYRIIKG